MTATTPKAKPLGPSLGGSVAAQVNCRDWRGGPRDRKLATVADIRNQVSRTDTGIEVPPLSDEEARETATGIWSRINEPNLVDNIVPTRDRATLVLTKGEDHAVTRIRLRKI